MGRGSQDPSLWISGAVRTLIRRVGELEKQVQEKHASCLFDWNPRAREFLPKSQLNLNAPVFIPSGCCEVDFNSLVFCPEGRDDSDRQMQVEPQEKPDVADLDDSVTYYGRDDSDRQTQVEPQEKPDVADLDDSVTYHGRDDSDRHTQIEPHVKFNVAVSDDSITYYGRDDSDKQMPVETQGKSDVADSDDSITYHGRDDGDRRGFEEEEEKEETSDDPVMYHGRNGMPLESEEEEEEEDDMPQESEDEEEEDEEKEASYDTMSSDSIMCSDRHDSDKEEAEFERCRDRCRGIVVNAVKFWNCEVSDRYLFEMLLDALDRLLRKGSVPPPELWDSLDIGNQIQLLVKMLTKGYGEIMKHINSINRALFTASDRKAYFKLHGEMQCQFLRTAGEQLHIALPMIFHGPDGQPHVSRTP